MILCLETYGSFFSFILFFSSSFSFFLHYYHHFGYLMMMMTKNWNQIMKMLMMTQLIILKIEQASCLVLVIFFMLDLGSTIHFCFLLPNYHAQNWIFPVQIARSLVMASASATTIIAIAATTIAVRIFYFPMTLL